MNTLLAEAPAWMEEFVQGYEDGQAMIENYYGGLALIAAAVLIWTLAFRGLGGRQVLIISHGKRRWPHQHNNIRHTTHTMKHITWKKKAAAALAVGVTASVGSANAAMPAWFDGITGALADGLTATNTVIGALAMIAAAALVWRLISRRTGK